MPRQTGTREWGLWWCPCLAAGLLVCLAAGCSGTKADGGDEELAMLETFRGGRYQDRERAMVGLLSRADMKDQKGGIYEVRSGFEREGQAADGGGFQLGRRDFVGGERAARSQAFEGGDREFRSQAFDASGRASGMGGESFEGVGESRMSNQEAETGRSPLGGQAAYGISREGSLSSAEEGMAIQREREAQDSQERNVRPVVIEDRSGGGGSMSESEVRSFLGKD